VQYAALAYSLGVDGMVYLREESKVARMVMEEALEQAADIAEHRVALAVNRGLHGK
jgi:hypothetical protein